MKLFPYGNNGVHMDELRVEPLFQNLEMAVTSPLRYRIAKLLIDQPEKEFTGREIARLLRVSHSGVQKAIRPLVEAGLAYEKRIGKSNVYWANKDSYLFKTFHRWFSAEDRIQQEVIETLQSKLEDIVVSATVFGSFAKGSAGPSSDLDLLIVARDRAEAEKRLASLAVVFARRYGIRISPKVVSESELKRKASLPYVKAAMTEGVLIAGKPLGRVLG